MLLYQPNLTFDMSVQRCRNEEKMFIEYLLEQVLIGESSLKHTRGRNLESVWYQNVSVSLSIQCYEVAEMASIWSAWNTKIFFF